jgi:hypothetical protein
MAALLESAADQQSLASDIRKLTRKVSAPASRSETPERAFDLRFPRADARQSLKNGINLSTGSTSVRH